jgi:purine-binding chemotaxis protein CheW
MTATMTMDPPSSVRQGEVQLVTFYVGDMLLGAEIENVEEINRQIDLTPVAHSHASVCGVTNLRGEVVTALDLRIILGIGCTQNTKSTRNVIVNAGGESIGLLVDRIADVVIARWSEIKTPPANLAGVDRRFLYGVYELESELLAVLNIEEVLTGN